MKKFITAPSFLALAALILSLASCKGRTTDTVESDGDTVEVNIPIMNGKISPDYVDYSDSTAEMTVTNDIN